MGSSILEDTGANMNILVALTLSCIALIYVGVGEVEGIPIPIEPTRDVGPWRETRRGNVPVPRPAQAIPAVRDRQNILWKTRQGSGVSNYLPILSYGRN